MLSYLAHALSASWPLRQGSWQRECLQVCSELHSILREGDMHSPRKHGCRASAMTTACCRGPVDWLRAERCQPPQSCKSISSGLSPGSWRSGSSSASSSFRSISSGFSWGCKALCCPRLLLKPAGPPVPRPASTHRVGTMTSPSAVAPADQGNLADIMSEDSCSTRTPWPAAGRYSSSA